MSVVDLSVLSSVAIWEIAFGVTFFYFISVCVVALVVGGRLEEFRMDKERVGMGALIRRRGQRFADCFEVIGRSVESCSRGGGEILERASFLCVLISVLGEACYVVEEEAESLMMEEKNGFERVDFWFLTENLSRMLAFGRQLWKQSQRDGAVLDGMPIGSCMDHISKSWDRGKDKRLLVSGNLGLRFVVDDVDEEKDGVDGGTVVL